MDKLLAGLVVNDGQKDVLHGDSGKNLYYLSTGDQLLGKEKGDITIVS